MHRFGKRKIIVMLMAMMLLFGVSVPATMAYLTVKTEPVKNTFVPVQTPDHDFEISVVGEKTLTGRDWQEGDTFSFELQVWDGKEWITKGTDSVAYDKENKDFNKFDFSDIVKAQLTEAKTYSFRIVESKGNLENVTYDESVHRFDVKVTADSAGAMDITTVIEVEDTDVVLDDVTGNFTAAVEFINRYTKPEEPPLPPDPEDIKIDFLIKKTVKNTGDGEIGPEGFDFKLVKNSTKEEYTAVSDAEGNAEFEITYSKDDIGKTYIYELSEVDEGVKNITYSDKVYNITVKIDKNQDNELFSTIRVDDKIVKKIEVKFENIYSGKETPTKPTDPTKPSDKDDGSKTGDDSNMSPFVVVMMVALAVMAVVLISGRRRKSS